MPDIPTELLVQIFGRLPQNDVHELGMVNRQWMKVALGVGCADASYLYISPANLGRIKYVLMNVPAAAHRLKCFKRMQLIGLGLSDDLKFVLLSIGNNIIELKLINVGHLPRLEAFLPNIMAASILQESKDHPPNIDFSLFPQLSSLKVDACRLAKSLLFKVALARTGIRLERLVVTVSPEVNHILTNVILVHSATIKDLRIRLYDPYSLNNDWRITMSRLIALESLELSGINGSSWLQETVERISSAAPLRQITLNDIEHLTPVVSSILQTKWATLNKLNIRCSSMIRDSTINAMAGLSSRLKELDLSFCITGSILVSALGQRPLTNLEKLNLEGCDQLSERSICLLIRLVPNLLSLNLSRCTRSVMNKTMAHIFWFATKLRELVLNQCYQVKVDLCWKDRIQDLEILQLQGVCSITDILLLEVFKFQKLKEVQITNCIQISATGVESLINNCPSIENLTLASCAMITDQAVFYIMANLGRLRKLDLNNCNKLTSGCLPYLEQSHHLEQLNLTGIDDLANEKNHQRVKNLYEAIMERNYRFTHTLH